MNRSKTRISSSLRATIASSAGNRCGYCLTDERITGHRPTIDHIIPEAKGGKTEEENLWLACISCNQFKGARLNARDPETDRFVRLFNPRRQKWKDHFKWSDDGTEIIGLTACGRATIESLKMNRAEIIGARWLWVQAGWWPPGE